RLPREHGGSLAGPVAFSPDTRLLAVARAPRQVCLLETETGLEVGRLTSPEPLRVERLSFSPDGSRLAVVLGNQTIQVWDLRLIRTQLAKMGLDWKPPPSPPAQDRPLQVEVLRPPAAGRPRDVEALYRRGLSLLRRGDFAAARD